MPRLDRYLLARLLQVWGLASLVLVLIYWVNRAIRVFDQLIADGQSAWVFLELTALALPSVIKIAVPLAAVVAVIIAVNRLAGDSELAVLQAAGLSPRRLARPVLVFGVIVALLMALIIHVLAPAAASRLAERQSEIAQSATARLLREGEFISPLPGLTIYIRDVAPSGEIGGLLLSDARDPGAAVTYTARAAWLVQGADGPQLVMLDGLIQRLSPGEGLVTTTFADLAYDLGPLLPAPDDGRRGWRELGTPDLLFPTPAIEAETGLSAARLRAEGHDRLAEPLLAPVGALLMLCALLLGSFSRFGLWRQIAAAVALAILVKGAESAAVGAVEADPSLWPLAYGPAILGLALSAALLWLAERPPLWRRVGLG